MFVLCLTYSDSIIYGLDVQRFQDNFTKWGPSARTCLGLAWGTLSEKELQNNTETVARKLAEDPTIANTMQVDPKIDLHLLFVTHPNGPKRYVHTMHIATQYLNNLLV